MRKIKRKHKKQSFAELKSHYDSQVKHKGKKTGGDDNTKHFHPQVGGSANDYVETIKEAYVTPLGLEFCRRSQTQWRIDALQITQSINN